MMNEDEKIKAAYALNLWTVSVSQIVEYNDVVVMEQEYDNIMNNLNLENMPKDETLLDVIKEIMDEITNMRMEDGDRKIIERKYQDQLKNAVWSAVPSVGAIFATSDPIAMGVTLATQVGIGYMNYRRNKAAYESEYEEKKWQIQRNRMEHLNGLQKQLFETAWRLADTYKFPDEYRLTQRQITEYNKALMETNPVKRYNNLYAMRSIFNAYPAFWYQIGSTANSIYRDKTHAYDDEIKKEYKDRANEFFEKYYQLNKFNLLRQDVITSSWALEYLELNDMNYITETEKAKELINTAEKFAGNDTFDVLELCAFEYLRIHDYDNAVRLFHVLVNKNYNVAVNTQILSGLYIRQMRSSDLVKAREARNGYKLLSTILEKENEKYILKIPNNNVDLSQWNPEWNKEKSFEEMTAAEIEKSQRKRRKQEENRQKAQMFYRKPIVIIYDNKFEKGIAEYFSGIITKNSNKIDLHLPSVSKCELKDFKKNQGEFEKNGTHIIMLGDSSEAKLVYKKVKKEKWDYSELGMNYVTYGNKTVLLARTLKNKEIDDFIKLASEVNKKHHVEIPSGVGSVEFNLLKDIFEGQIYDAGSAFATVVTGVVLSPLLVFGQTLENVANGIQATTNLKEGKEMKFLQYCILIYKYLASENALID